MPAYLSKQTLRAKAMASDLYSPKGWTPRLKLTLMGPAPPSAELVWTVHRPDDARIWFEQRTGVPELVDGACWSGDLYCPRDGMEIAQTGRCRFTIRLACARDGVGALLHEGTFMAVRHGAGRWAIEPRGALDLALVGLDVYDEPDAPRLRTRFVLAGDPGVAELGAVLLKDGAKLHAATHLQRSYTYVDTLDGALAVEFIAEWDQVRGWNNIEGWNEHWHRLDRHPGIYEIQVARRGQCVKIMAFNVGRDGRIAAGHRRIEPDEAGRPMLWLIDGAASPDLCYGDADRHGALAWTVHDMYRHRKENTP